MIRKPHRKKRPKPRFRRRSGPGALPGTMRAHPDAPRPVVRVLAYGPHEFVERVVCDVDAISGYLDRYAITWINVDGLGDVRTIQELGNAFGLHVLALEDVINTHQRAKVEAYDSHLFIVARMVALAEHLETEQLSLFLGKKYVLTFQERPGDCLEPVRQRIRKSGGRIREGGTDYLAYALLDAVIDSYFPIAERFADRLDELEDQVAIYQHQRVIEDIHSVRSDLLLLRRCIRPHREAMNQLVRDESALISGETRVFLRDCYDHTIQLIDLLEVYREMCADLRDYYLSLVSNRLNEVMKVLTIIATIFMPLSFIAGIYGMNFDTSSAWNMPELHWRYGYLFALGLMGMVAAGLVAFFWRKGWIGERTQRRDPVGVDGGGSLKSPDS